MSDRADTFPMAVHLPRTSARNAQGIFLKILSSVDPRAQSGFGFEGRFAKPGASMEESILYPPGSAVIPLIVLECAGATGLTPSGRKAVGHHRSEMLYVLWRYCPQSRSWEELGRACSASWDWAIDLRPLAVRALAETRQTNFEILPSLEAVTVRIAGLLARELEQLNTGDRGRVLGVLHDQFASRLSMLA